MITKPRASALPIGPCSEMARQARPWPMPPWTTEEQQERIAWLSQRINGYVQFMCKIGNLDGTSAEAKEKAIAAFYEHMIVVERELGCIHDNFQLG
jgi:hypothetical protein